MKPKPQGQALSRTKGDSRLGLSMARKSTPHFSQFSELMRKCMQGRCGQTMWSYTCKLPLSGRVNSCSAPKCFLNVQLVFPTLNLCTFQSLQLIYISHIYIWVLIKINVPGKGTIADQPRINRGPTGGNRGGIFFPMSFVQKMK